MSTPALRAVVFLALCAIPAAFVAPTPAFAQAPPENEAILVRCPALEVDDNPESEDPGQPHGPVRLVVIGTAGESGKDEGSFERPRPVTIDRTLYGSCADKTVLASRCFGEKGSRRIFELVPDPYNEAWKVLYSLDAREETAVSALCAARLDFTVLSSESIFIGQTLTAGDDFDLTVRVQRRISGPEIPPDTVVRCSTETYMRTSGKLPLVRKEPEIFLIWGIHEDHASHEKTYQVTTTLPADQEKAVLAALQRRDEYPVSEEEVRGEHRKIREIGFRGTVADAIPLLGSWSDGAVCLGARHLIRTSGRGVTEIIAAIEKDLPLFETREYEGYRRLRNLIRVLGVIEKSSPSGSIEKLAGRFLDSVEVKPPELPAEARPSRRSGASERDETSNHGLAWLLLELPAELVGTRFGERLRKMRDTAERGWKTELQLALDACHVEDNADVASAMAHAKDLKSAHSQSGPRLGEAGVDTVRFSPSGKLLAVADRHGAISVLRTADWGLEGSLEESKGSPEFEFDSDEGLIYVARHGQSKVNRIEWRTGKVERTYESPGSRVTGIALSREDRVLLVRDYYEHTVRAWDPAAGTCTRTWNWPEGCSEATVSPDGKTVAIQTAPDVVSIDAVQGKEHQEFTIPRDEELAALEFSADAQYLVTVTLSYKAAGRTRTIRVLKATMRFNQVAEANFPAGDHDAALALSPGGQWVAIAQKCTLRVMPLPDLVPVREIHGDDDGNIVSMHFSPSEKLLAVGDGGRSVCLLKLPELQPIFPFEGHRNPPRQLFFAPDGKSLVSLGGDHQVCRWDLATMRMQSRRPIPDGWDVVGTREPDGKYALCCSTSSLAKALEQGGELSTKARVIALDTMETTCELDLPIGRWGNCVAWLDDHRAVVDGGKETCIFDYLSGTIIRRFGDTGRAGSGEFLSDDGTGLIRMDCDIRMGCATLDRVDLEKGTVSSLGKVSLDRLTGNSIGLAPGGRFYIADPGMYVFDLKTLQPVSQREFRDTDLLAHAFDATGDRYAVVTGGRIFIGNNLQGIDPGTRSTIRIHETRTGKTLLAFPASTRWIRTMKFSPAGDRFAVVNDDGTIEVWPLH